MVKKINVTIELVDFIFCLRHKKLPVEVYEKAKLHLLDTLSVALAAAKSEPVNLILNSILEKAITDIDNYLRKNRERGKLKNTGKRKKILSHPFHCFFGKKKV